jgi:hypothetical protein
MRRLLLYLLLLLPTIAFAQTARRAQSDWHTYPDKGCIGGSECRGRQLRVALDEDRPVVAVRFSAHDQIGTKADGSLRVRIDGNTIKSAIDIPRRGETFTLDVDELLGRYLIFEPASDDEVAISDIAVLYARDTTRRGPRPPDVIDRRPTRADGWREYPRAGMCIGGSECRKNGTRITIALDDAPVLGVRFRAQDNIGTRADGRLSVRIDDKTIGWYIDVKRDGRQHELDVENVEGTRLVIETATDDEVEVKDIAVLYGRGSRHHDGGRGEWEDPREITDEGGCIGGDECGGRRARIRIALRGRPVDQIRFYARDDIGAKAGGELRIRIDDEIVQDYLDIPREGRTFTIDGHHIAGDYLIIEPSENDEVMVKDVRVRFFDPSR